MSSATWTFVLADSKGTTLCELTTASGRSITWKRNAPGEARLTVSHHDDAAQLFLDALRTSGPPTLRCYRRGPNDSAGVLRFHGYAAPFVEDLEETATLTLVFRSPFARLLGESSDRGRFTADYVFYQLDAGQIAQHLLNQTNNDDGASGLIVGPGLWEATQFRNRAYQNANVGDEITNLALVDGGYDFYETFIEPGVTLPVGTMAYLNIVATLGSDRSAAVRFEYGETTLSNVRAVTRTTEPPVNKVRVLGGNMLTSVKTDAQSIASNGTWVMQVAASDVIDQQALDDRAAGLLRVNPVKTIEFTPEYGLECCPRPFDDFWIGDRVSFLGRRGAFTENASVRVNGIQLVIDENGIEQAQITDPTTPGQEAAMRARLTVEVV